MDTFKQSNVKKATTLDYNASVVTLKNRGKVGKQLNRYARRKLKQKLIVEE